MTPPSASGSLFAASRSSSTTMVLDRDEDEKAALAAAEAYGDERPAVGYFDGTAPLADTTSFASEVYRPTTQFAVPAGPARGRPNRRSHISSFSSLASNSVSVGTPRSTLPIIPSSRASPVLGPTRSGAFGVGALGLGLFNKLSLAAASEDSDIPPLSQPSVAPADLSLPSPLASILPPPPPAQSRGPIHPGAIWSGTQRSGRASYDVRVTFTHVDLESGKAGGYLEIHQLTKDLPELVTYFDAEIVGSKFGFLTNKEEWGATEADDWKHWSRFPLFRTLAKPTILKDKEAKKEAAAAGDRHEGAVPKDQMLFAHKNRPVVFMRWKERFVVPDHRKEDIQGASFAGFYYVCCDLSPPPDLTPACSTPTIASSGPAYRPRRSSSASSSLPAPATGRSTSRTRVPPSPTLGTSPLLNRNASIGPGTTGPAPVVTPRPRRSSSTTTAPGTFSYAAIARRNSNVNSGGAASETSTPTAEVPPPSGAAQSRPALASATWASAPAVPGVTSAPGSTTPADAPKAEEPAGTQAVPPPSLLSLDDFPLPSSPSLSSPTGAANVSLPGSAAGPGGAGRRRMSTAPLPSPSLGQSAEAAAALATDESAEERGRTTVRSSSNRAEDVGLGLSGTPTGTKDTLEARGGWQDARICAYYFHANSEPYQELVLKYRPQHRGGSADYQFA